MKMKSIFLISALSLLAVSAIGVGVGLKAENKADYQVAEATEEVPSTIYLKITGTKWQGWGDDLKVHMWGGSGAATTWGVGEAGTKVTVGSETYFKFTVSNRANVIFVNSSKWGDDSKQNRTQDQAIPTNGNDLFIINTNYDSDLQGGTWSKMYAPSGSTIYLVDGYSWHGNARAYVWGTTNNGAFPGQAMTRVEEIGIEAKVGESYFSGLHLYKYTTSIEARYVIFSNATNESEKTGDLLLNDGEIYFYGVSDNIKATVEALLLVKSSLGTQDVNSIDGKTYTNSVCGISLENATTICGKYDSAINSGNADVAKTARESTFNTYDPENSFNSNDDVTLERIVAALKVLYPALAAPKSLTGTEGQNIVVNNTTLIVIVALVATVTTFGGYFLLRKRKED